MKSKIYMLYITKPRWELKVYENHLILNRDIIKRLADGEVVQYNSVIYLSLSKKLLSDKAGEMLDKKIEELNNELLVWKGMKPKITRK